MERQGITTKVLRQFGFMVGGVFLFIAVWPFLWRHEEVRLWAAVPGSLLVLIGSGAPSLLKPVYQGWMALGHALGWINTRIILGVLFYGIVTPMGVVMRLTGRDPMQRSFDPTAQTYRVLRQPRAASHMKNMF